MPEFVPGTPAVDKESGGWVIILSHPYGKAYEVERGGQPVARYESNVGYPDKDSVVDAVFPTDLSLLVQDGQGDPSTYTYPKSRLRPFHLKNGVGLASGMKECEYCGEEFAPGSAYIEGAEGEEYCDINCMNEALRR